MKTLSVSLLLALALLVPQHHRKIFTTSGTTFTLAHPVDSHVCASGSQTCAFAVTSTCSGCVETFTTSVYQTGATYITGISGTGWVEPAGCQNYYAAATDSVSCAYNLSAAASVTSYTVTFTASLTASANVMHAEYSWTGATPTYDNSGAITRSTSANPQSGIGLTLSGTSDIIIQFQGYGGPPTSVSGGSPAYGNLTTGSATNLGWADSENTASGTAISWNYSGNQLANVGALAIK
jgi:hypothetical protein